ncbi:MAG: DUF4339 domain-containing protein [Flavobacteriales bacterium]
MTKYHIHNGQQQEGPFDKEELRAKVIKPTTLVWYEGASDWIEAGKIDELKDLFTVPPPLKASPPPLGAPVSAPPPPPSSTNPWKWIRIGLGLALLGFIVVRFIDVNTSHDRPGSYLEQVMTIEETERQDPTRFLSVEGKYHTNFWGDQMVIEGVILNNATVANYKDVVIQVHLLSETDTELDSKNYVVYKRFPAHGRTEFSLRVGRPKAAKKVSLDVFGATPLP